MKKFLTLLSVCICAVIFFTALGGQAKDDVRVYYLDKKLHKLVGISEEVNIKNTKKAAEDIITLLKEGRDSSMIINLIPKEAEIEVSLHKTTAIVDIPHEIKIPVNYSLENEKLFVYQIVNSLSSLPGVDYVKFTVGGKDEKNLMGFLDMREIFTFQSDI